VNIKQVDTVDTKEYINPANSFVVFEVIAFVLGIIYTVSKVVNGKDCATNIN
jgi:hypothetical protein